MTQLDTPCWSETIHSCAAHVLRVCRIGTMSSSFLCFGFVLCLGLCFLFGGSLSNLCLVELRLDYQLQLCSEAFQVHWRRGPCSSRLASSCCFRSYSMSLVLHRCSLISDFQVLDSALKLQFHQVHPYWDSCPDQGRFQSSESCWQICSTSAYTQEVDWACPSAAGKQHSLALSSCRLRSHTYG